MLVKTHVIRYYSNVKQEMTVHPHGMSLIEAIEESRTLPQSEISEITLDVSTSPPTVVSCVVLE